MSVAKVTNYPFHHLNKVCELKCGYDVLNSVKNEITIHFFREFLYGKNGAEDSCGKNVAKPSLSSYDLLMIAKGMALLGGDDSSEDFIEIANRIDVHLESHFGNYLLEERELSQTEIKSFLTHLGILPSHLEAKKNFWGLRENWWKQIRDGHPEDSDMYALDLGAVDRLPQQGYLEGIFLGSKLFIEKMDEGLSCSLYAETHCMADRKPNGIVEADPFRKYERRYLFDFFDPESLTLQNDINYLRHASEVTKFYLNIIHFESHPVYFREYKKSCPDKFLYSHENICHIKSQYEELKFVLLRYSNISIENLNDSDILLKINKTLMALEKKRYDSLVKASDKINNSIANSSQNLDIKSSLAKCSITTDGLSLACHDSQNTNSAVEIVNKAVFKFNFQLKYAQKLAYQHARSMKDPSPKGFVKELISIQSKYQKTVVHLAGKLFSELEWVGLWAKAQRRTDLILLNGILSREGVHPVILNLSHYSLCNTSEKWIEYLEGGLKKYEEELAVQD